jgi:6-bladed beta-propeller
MRQLQRHGSTAYCAAVSADSMGEDRLGLLVAMARSEAFLMQSIRLMRSRMSRVRSTATAMLVMLCPVALTSQSPQATTRDSAGVRIISFDKNALPPQLELRHTGLELGAEAGAEFVRVTAALRMPNGRILVADGGRRQLLRFAADGTFEKVIGRDGQGPGEFARLTWMGRHSRDLVGVYDFSQVRYSVFSDTGFVRQVRLESSAEVRAVEMQPLGALSNGAIIVTGGRSVGLAAEGPPRRLRMSSPVVQFSADGVPGRVIGRYPGTEIEVTMVKNGPAAGRFANDVPLFGRGSALGLSQGLLVVIDNERFQFDVIDPTGQVLRSVRRMVSNARVQPSHKAASVRERVSAARPEFREMLRADLESKGHAVTFPALQDRLVIDASGRVWLGEYLRPGDREQTWWIFTVDGRMNGRVTVPRNLVIMDAGTGWVLGAWTGEDDVVTLRLYDLRGVAP